MVVDWLAIWGVAQAAGLVFKPILEDLAKESAKDYAKDFFKDCLKKVIHLPEKNVLKEAYGKALTEFLHLMQAELQNAGYQEAQIKQYVTPLKQFVAQKDIAAALGQAFEADCRSIDTSLLAKTWQELNLPYLPEDFDWTLVTKPYVRAVKKIVQNSETLRPVFAAQEQAAMAAGMQELVGIVPEYDLNRYAEGLREQYGNLKLESLDTTGVYYSELKLWRIFIPQDVRECQEFLPQVYEVPKEHVRRLQQSGELDRAEIVEAELEQYRRVYVEQPIRPVLEVVGDPNDPEAKQTPVNYAVILGDPGSGKSTLLQYLALVWADRPVSELLLHPLPLLIELRTYARDKQEKKCQDILSFIHAGNITCRLNQQQLHDQLRSGEAIALFDGIDEVFDPALRDEVVTDIHRFTNDYPKVRVIATSRWLGYKAQRLRDAGFRHFMLQELNEDQIETFVQRWHDLTFKEGADKIRKRERLQKAIQDSKAIRELAGNPLLLTMMAILNRNQELPRDRPELYNQASRVLLHQWDVERALVEDYRLDPKTIDYRDKQAMLRKVAYHMQSSPKGLAGNIISVSDLEQILTDYLKTIEFEQPPRAARLMINQLHTRNFILCDLGAGSYAFIHRTFLEYFCAAEIVHLFEKRSIRELCDQVFGKHWQDETWHEVLLLICGMIGEKTAERAEKIVYYLMHQNGITCIRYDGEPALPSSYGSLFLAADCFAEIRNTRKNQPVSIILLESLKHLCQTDNFWIGEFAVNKIARVWMNHPDTLLWLKEFVQRDLDGDSLAQRATIRELSKQWMVDPTIRPWIQACASSNKDWQLRYTALEVIGEMWAGDLDMLPILQLCAEQDEDEGVRGLAIEVLAQSWGEHSSIVPILMSRAQIDDDWVARILAVAGLAKICRSQPEWFDFFHERAIHDPFEREKKIDDNPRQIALEALLTHYSTHPKTIELLHDRAQNDPDEQLRQWAQKQVQQLGNQEG